MALVTDLHVKKCTLKGAELFDNSDFQMSEELTKKGYNKQGLVIGNYEYFDLGDTTLNQLKKAKIITIKKVES